MKSKYSNPVRSAFVGALALGTSLSIPRLNAGPDGGILGSLAQQAVQRICERDVRSNNKQKYNKQKKGKVMKMKNTVIRAIIAVTQSEWIRPAVMTLAILVAVIGVTGCDSGHGGNHSR